MFVPVLLVLLILFLILFTNRDFFLHLFGCSCILTVKVSPAEGGVVSPFGGKYQRNSRLTLAAIPNSGWHFNRWEGDLSGTNNPATIEMDRHKLVTAIFVKPVDKEVPTIPRSGRVPSVT